MGMVSLLRIQILGRFREGAKVVDVQGGGIGAEEEGLRSEGVDGRGCVDAVRLPGVI